MIVEALTLERVEFEPTFSILSLDSFGLTETC
jgi:hypothetical protein